MYGSNIIWPALMWHVMLYWTFLDITTIFQLPAAGVIHTRVLTGLQASMTSTDLGVKISLLLTLM